MQNWQRLTSRMCFRPLPKLICMVESRTCMELWLVIWSKMIFHKGIGFHMILSHTRQKKEKKKRKKKNPNNIHENEMSSKIQYHQKNHF